MSVTYIAIGLLAVSVIGITVLLVYLRLLKHKYKKNSALFAKDNLVVKNKSSFKDIFDRLYQMVYMTFVKMPVIKYYTKKTRLKLEMTNDYTEYEIRKRIQKEMPKKNQVVLVYCEYGGRSRNVCYELRRMGYSNVFNLYGGLNEM